MKNRKTFRKFGKSTNANASRANLRAQSHKFARRSGLVWVGVK